MGCSDKIGRNLIQTLSPRLRDALVNKHGPDKRCNGVEPKGTVQTEEGHGRGKRLGGQERGSPVDTGRDPGRRAAKPDGEQLAHHQPRHGTETERETDDKHDAGNEGQPLVAGGGTLAALGVPVEKEAEEGEGSDDEEVGGLE